MSRTRKEIKNYFDEHPELKSKIELAKSKELEEKNRKSPPFWRGGFFIDWLIDNYNYLIGSTFAEEQGEDYIANAMAKSIREELINLGNEELKEEGEKFGEWFGIKGVEFTKKVRERCGIFSSAYESGLID